MRSRALGVAMILLAAGCGSRRETLATVGDRRITRQDFISAFSSMSPSEQVDVLEPGGRLALVDRLIDKNLLEIALESRGAPGSEWWVSLYEDAALAPAWTRARFTEVMGDNPDMNDFLYLSGTFSIRVILVPDSTTAVKALENWRSPGFPSGMVMSLAPWSTGGSSHREMEGYLWQFPVDLQIAFSEHQGDGPVIEPLYGAWAVAELEVDPTPALDSIPPEAVMSVFNLARRTEMDLALSSGAISALAEALVVDDDGYHIADTSGLDRSEVLASYAGGGITTGDVIDLVTRTDRWQFFGNPPAELAEFIMPTPSGVAPGIDLWFFVSSVAQTRWAAAQARAAGMEDETGSTALMASVEHLLRLEVLDRVEEPDSSSVMAWYEANIEYYTIPERRSALVAYLPAASADSAGTPSSFAELARWTVVDSSGAPCPTPLQPEDAFGAVGGLVFSSEPGQLTGPVEIGAEGFRGYVEVVDVLPPEPAQPERIWRIIRDDCRIVRIQEAFSSFMSELRTETGVEIDTSAVENVDPWAGTI
ncbi:MAG: hypothetical protein BWX47_01330 [candidate division Hyd24-12 bacterium ADurb.Bin004]|nr:MAG: hypothetical protein AO396_01345 [Candidatus Fermentibacter daniensis]OQC69230.1 MAG: hypothetical protein BWX47_01330 [candidate division Hyd24-12 bacterium ADurb.Bin004]